MRVMNSADISDDFDLDDDDFFAEAIQSIPESNLASPSTSQASTPLFETKTYKSERTDTSVTPQKKWTNNQKIVLCQPRKHSESLSNSLSQEKDKTLNNDKSSQNNETCDTNDISVRTLLTSSLAFHETHSNPFDPENEINFNNTYTSNNFDNSELVNKVSTNDKVSEQVLSFINSRFSPGFTEKQKKRKFSGPAGFLSKSQELKSEKKLQACKKNINLKKDSKSDINSQSILGSQPSDELQMLSWKTLQANVSSCSNLLSTAKYFSIHCILQELSKKELPKHMVIPFLCVLIKKTNSKDPNFNSVLMDGTGEINGKFDKEVMLKYGEHIVKGSSVILKKVVSLCNVLIIKCETLVTIYLADGTVKHLQDLKSVLENAELQKPINGRYFVSSDENYKCVVPSEHSTAVDLEIPKKKSISDSKISSVMHDIFHKSENTTYAKSLKFAPVVKSIKNNDLNIEDDMDDFDELLGSLDEKSFLD